MNTGVHACFKLWLSPDIHSGVGLLDHMVALVLVLKGTSILVSHSCYITLYISTNSVGGFLLIL